MYLKGHLEVSFRSLSVTQNQQAASKFWDKPGSSIRIRIQQDWLSFDKSLDFQLELLKPKLKR